MSWNDGISKEMSDMFATTLNGLGEEAISAAKEVIDEDAQRFASTVTSKTPVHTGGLAASFKLVLLNRGQKWYGYSAEFVGTSPDGVPYQKIANILNYGRAAGDGYGAISGTHFMTVATHRLKGMNGRIEARIASKLAKRTE